MLPEAGDEDHEDVSSLLAPRFRRAAAPPPEPSDTAPEAGDRPSAEMPAGPVSAPPTPASLAEIPSAESPTTPAELTADAATAIVGKERFLPVAEPVLVSPPEPGPMRIFVPAGSAVHVIEEGRVAEIDEHIAGEVTIRVDGDRFYRYRRLMPSSVCVSAGEHVSPGAVIGTVGDAIDEDPPCLVVGLQSGDGAWADICAELTGLPDPGELGLCVSNLADEWVDPLAADSEAGEAGADRDATEATDDEINALLSSRNRRP